RDGQPGAEIGGSIGAGNVGGALRLGWLLRLVLFGLDNLLTLHAHKVDDAEVARFRERRPSRSDEQLHDEQQAKRDESSDSNSDCVSTQHSITPDFVVLASISSTLYLKVFKTSTRYDSSMRL